MRRRKATTEGSERLTSYLARRNFAVTSEQSGSTPPPHNGHRPVTKTPMRIDHNDIILPASTVAPFMQTSRPQIGLVQG